MKKLNEIGLSPLKAGEECSVNGGAIKNRWIVCCRDIGVGGVDIRANKLLI